MNLLWVEESDTEWIDFNYNEKYVRYITYNSYAISVVPPSNRLWAQVSV